MFPRRTLVVVAASAALAAVLGPGLGACAGTPTANAAPTPTTTVPTPPKACPLVTLAEAKTALGGGKDLRQEPSTTNDSRSFCTFLTTDTNTQLVVLTAATGEQTFEHELALAEGDLSTTRKPVTGVTNGYVLSGTELGAPTVIVGVRSGQLWFTITLRVDGASRQTLETRAVVVAGAALKRLPG